MLNIHPRAGSTGPGDTAPDPLAKAVWIDLLDPTPEEVSRVEAATGLRLPTRQSLSEIEATSRLKVQDGVLSMSAPLIAHTQADDVWTTSPTGFVLAKSVCVTLRYGELGAFDAVGEAFGAEGPADAEEAFTRILEEIVDRVADHFEAASDALDGCSTAIFHGEAAKTTRLVRDTDQLRRIMTDIGCASERMSQGRYTLVCIGRMAQFVADRARAWLSPAILDRLGGVKADIASLEQFEEHLLGRVQMLQDAATAFISIEQNDVVKVLTIASVVGIPPVLVVGVYGMNFKNMPELNWTWGYPYALALLVVSTVVPLIWFKWKDWM